MRVVCINDSNQYCHDLPMVKKGNIYTVIEKRINRNNRIGNELFTLGIHYILAEMGTKAAFHESMFIPINEEQQDETEFNRNYQTTKV